MSVNIREAFLHHSENGCLRFLRQPREIIRKVQIDRDFAALGESLHIPAKGGQQASFVE
jgi:hypothetical protein